MLAMLLVTLTAGADAREVDVKVHDMQGVVTGDVHVELVGPGGRTAFDPKDDGADPDKIAGDHMYTAHGDVPAENGEVVVTGGGKTWRGGFGFDLDSDPVLLIGLQPDGLAGASTKEVMFVPEPPPNETPTPTTSGSGHTTRTSLPAGMWAGWILGLAAFAVLAALAWLGGRAGREEAA